MHLIRATLLAFMLPVALVACALTPAMREPPGEQALGRVQAGMSVQQVEEILGRPDGGTEVYGEETVSGWRVPVRGHGIRAAYFNVHYRGGKVVRTSRSAEYVGG